MSEENHEYIIPHYKMIITYDVIMGKMDSYRQYVMGEFVPSLQESKVYMTEIWDTAYGDCPNRMVSFVTEDLETIEDFLNGEEWAKLESKFKGYVKNYTRKVVAYERGFQFITN